MDSAAGTAAGKPQQVPAGVASYSNNSRLCSA
jgi:hypothetical protein